MIGLNTTQNEGAHTMSADGRFLVFTACDRRDSYGSCDLYSATILDGKWTKPVNMGQKVNNVGWDSQPQLTPDGRTLYFSSKRKENIGGADIWMTWRDEKMPGSRLSISAQTSTLKVMTKPRFYILMAKPSTSGRTADPAWAVLISTIAEKIV